MSDEAAARRALAARLEAITRELEEANERFRVDSEEKHRLMLVREETMRALLAVEDADARRITRMLHDKAGQNVAALLLGLNALSHDASLSPAGKHALATLRKLSQSVGRDLHELSVELRPTSLEDHGLARGLATFVEEWSRVEQIPVEFDASGLMQAKFPAHIEAMLYSIIRDILRNLAKETRATCVTAILQSREDSVIAVLEADGNGVAEASPNLAIARARIALLGGELVVEPGMEGGVTFIVRLPQHSTGAGRV